MSKPGVALPIVASMRKGGDQDHTVSGATRTYHDEHVLIYTLTSNPGASMNSRTTHKRWEDDGIQWANVASRISVVIKGMLHVTHYHDFERTNQYYTQVRDVGGIGGTHRNSKGFTTQNPVTPNTEWQCIYLKGKKVLEGTTPVYYEGLPQDILPTLSTNNQSLFVLLSGRLRVNGEGDFQDHVSVRGDIGLVRTMSCLTPVQGLIIEIEDDVGIERAKAVEEEIVVPDWADVLEDLP